MIFAALLFNLMLPYVGRKGRSSTHKGYVYPLPVKIDYFDVNVLTCFFT